MKARIGSIILACVFALGTVSCGKGGASMANPDLDIPPAQGQAKVLVVFVHGILGNAVTTFKDETAQQGWPELLASDSSLGAPVQVLSLGYLSNPVRQASNIHEIATRLQTQLQDKKVFERFEKVIFVTHSMGGLVAKRMLLQVSRDDPAAFSRVAGIFFLATPAGGADLADMAAWVSGNPQFKDMKSADVNTFLQSEDDDWAAALRKRTESSPYPKAFCVYEKLSIGPMVVVPRSRAQTGCDERSIPYDRDHIHIVKPKSRSDEVYEYVAARIRRIIADEYVQLKVSATLLSPHGGRLPESVALRSGDQYVLEVTANKPAWFYVFATDSRGLTERYFPSQAGGGQAMKRRDIRVPTEPGNSLTLDHNRGREQVVVLASSSSLVGLEKLGKEVASAGTKGHGVLEIELSKRGATIARTFETRPKDEFQQLTLATSGAEASAVLHFWHD